MANKTKTEPEVVKVEIPIVRVNYKIMVLGDKGVGKTSMIRRNF